jgi:hypothetical protein
MPQEWFCGWIDRFLQRPCQELEPNLFDDRFQWDELYRVFHFDHALVTALVPGVVHSPDHLMVNVMETNDRAIVNALSVYQHAKTWFQRDQDGDLYVIDVVVNPYQEPARDLHANALLIKRSPLSRQAYLFDPYGELLPAVWEAVNEWLVDTMPGYQLASQQSSSFCFSRVGPQAVFPSRPTGRGLCLFWTSLIVFLWARCPAAPITAIIDQITALERRRGELLLNRFACYVISRRLGADRYRNLLTRAAAKKDRQS